MLTYVCSLTNEKGPGRIPCLISDDPERIKKFVELWDRPGRAVYECVSPLKDHANRRAIETVAALTLLHIDIDLRALATPRDEVLRKLQQLPLRGEIRDSGGGFHVIFRLKEQLPFGTDDFKHGNRLRSQLTRVLCGDPAPDHAAALLRRVDTHNRKYPGEPRLVRVLQEAPPVDLIELEELLDTLGDTPLFAWKPKTNGHAKHTPDAPADAPGRLISTLALRG